MRKLLKLLNSRVNNERGSVGVLIALAIFAVCGMLTMTWNTVQLSKAKMRVQNAADAAALEFCIWQARGMNAEQNINDEAFVCFDTGRKLLNFTVKTETALTLIPIKWVRAIAEGLLCAVPGALSGLMTHYAGNTVLKAASEFYYYTPCAFGYIGAQQLASENGASGMIGDWFQIGSWNCGLYALGFSVNMKDTIILPLTKQTKNLDSCFTLSENESKVMKKVLDKAILSGLFSFCGTGKPWSFQPYTSLGDKTATTEKGKKNLGDLPKPAVFISLKYKNEIATYDLSTWSGDEAKSGMHDSPVFAIAAARCITGDVIKHNAEPEKDGTYKTVNQRPFGFGAGATAKLIPVADALGEIPKVGGVLKTITGGIIYH